MRITRVHCNNCKKVIKEARDLYIFVSSIRLRATFAYHGDLQFCNIECLQKYIIKENAG